MDAIMLVISKILLHKGKGNMRTNKMDMYMRGYGQRTYNMERVSSFMNEMETNSKDSLCTVVNLDKVNMNSTMGEYMKGIFIMV